MLVGDSYGDVALPEIQPYIASIKLLYLAHNTAKEIADGIAAARNVVLESVEREFVFRVSGAEGAPVTPQFIALVRAALAAHPLPH